MERLTLEDMIKALKCVASQDTVGDCYADHENFMHMHDKHKRIVCGTGEDLRDYISGKEAVGCPYYQNTYGCCFENGELSWLKDVAELLKELKSYKDAEEQGLLMRLPCKEVYSKSGDFVYLIYDYEIIECVHCGLGIDPLSGKAYITLATDEKLFPYRSPDPEQDLDPTDWCTNATDVEVSELGKTVFLTREEAEKKLEEMQNAKNA
jgi:hypothetical protein